ncbi:hypothetical protein HDE_03952 [Halotydeus destructor]|nr:hypothetical protein HDE_03952 [Halotydeus destructor]
MVRNIQLEAIARRVAIALAWMTEVLPPSRDGLEQAFAIVVLAEKSSISYRIDPEDNQATSQLLVAMVALIHLWLANQRPDSEIEKMPPPNNNFALSRQLASLHGPS